jgi:hypothetical protein
MSTSPSNPLPRAVKAIDLGEAWVHFAKEKLVVSSKAVGASEHLTVHFGPISKELDVHKTHTAADGVKTYETLFKIAHKDIELMMEELAAPILESLISVARPLTLEYMERQGMGAIVGPLPTQANLGAAIDVRKRRLTINEEKFAAEYSTPKYLDELYDLEEGKIFILICRANRRDAHRVGFGFPVTDRRSRRRLVWIPDKVLEKQLDRLSELFQAAALKYATVHNFSPQPNLGTDPMTSSADRWSST